MQEAEAVSDLLPIAVRVPKPSAAAAVFYDETDGSIFDVRYFNDATVTGLPPTAGLGGMSTLAAGYAPVNLQAGDRVAVAIAMSFRRACNTFDAGHPQPTGLLTGPAPCFEDGYGPGVPGYANVNDFCNQPPSSGTQLVDCFYSTGTPTQTMRRGLHFIRGYGNASVTNGRPAVQSAYLSDVIASPCVGTSYFNSERTNSCAAQLNVAVDIGDLIEDIDAGPGVNMQQTRTALTPSNIEVRYKLVRDDGTTFCDFGDTCNLKPQGNGPGDVTFSTDGTTGANGAPHLPLRQASRANAVALQIRVQGSTVDPSPGGCGVDQSFNNNCRWFYTSTTVSPSVPPTDAQVLASPIQRAFMGYLDTSGPIRWLRLTADQDCNPATLTDISLHPQAASQPFGNRCFYMEMGMKGAEAKDQDEFGIAFNEGTGPSQMGAVLCDPAIPPGQILIIGVVQGCQPLHGPNGFDTTPLCPNNNNNYDLPNPGGVFSDWPPVECVVRRATGSMNQLLTGLEGRILGGTNVCPSDVPETDPLFRWGRNYWHRNNNMYDAWNFANPDGLPGPDPAQPGSNLNPADPRLVTLFLTPYDSFDPVSIGTDKIYPIVYLGQFYITGWGRMNGGGNLNVDDPCSGGNVLPNQNGLPAGQGNEPPPDLMDCGGNCSGVAVWGHFVKGVLLGGGGTPSGNICSSQNLQVCIPVLVE